MFAVTYQLPGLVACSFWDHRGIGFHTFCDTNVLWPSLSVMAA
jgi:hypothetical protein